MQMNFSSLTNSLTVIAERPRAWDAIPISVTTRQQQGGPYCGLLPRVVVVVKERQELKDPHNRAPPLVRSRAPVTPFIVFSMRARGHCSSPNSLPSGFSLASLL